MKIVVLDGFTTAGYDLDFSVFEKYGELICYDETDKCDIVSRAKDADIIISNKTRITSDELDQLKKCLFIDLISTGYDALDAEYAGIIGIPVSNVPSYSEKAVAQCTFSHILNISNHTGVLSTLTRQNWAKTKTEQMRDLPMFELCGKTLGLFGFGKIAKEVAKIALSFGMNVIACAKHDFSFECVKQVSFEQLLEQSDIFSIHVPCTGETLGIINKKNIEKMKDGVIIINTARGAVIVENDLYEALECGKVSACGLDVLTVEPPKNTKLLSHKNCFVTPHTAWAATQTRQRLIDKAVQNLEAFLSGNPINVINKGGKLL